MGAGSGDVAAWGTGVTITISGAAGWGYVGKPIDRHTVEIIVRPRRWIRMAVRKAERSGVWIMVAPSCPA